MTDGKNARKPRSGRKGRSHDPSNYRRIIKDAKRDGAQRYARDLVREAKKLNDPYYTSLALISISANPAIPLDSSTSIAEQAFNYYDKEQRLWRRSELLIELVRKITSWKLGSSEVGIPNVRMHLFQNALGRISTMPPGKERSETVKGAASKLSFEMMGSLMETAMGNEGNELEDMRTVVRWWMTKLREEKTDEGMISTSLTTMSQGIEHVGDSSIKGKLFGYLDLQMRKNWIKSGNIDPFSNAVGTAVTIEEEEERLETLRYLVSISEDETSLERIAAEVDSFSDTINSVRLLTAMAGRGDKIGSAHHTHEWLRKANERVPKIEVPDRRCALRLNIMQGFALSGSSDDARDQLALARSDCELIEDEGHRAALENRIGSTARRLELIDGKGDRTEDESGEGSLDRGVADGKEKVPDPVDYMGQKLTMEISGSHRHIIALYDAYEGGVKPTHLRAIARAAPLCMAYDLDLALIGFPTSDLNSIVNATARETNIGRGGSILEDLVEQDRVILAPAERSADPGGWNVLGVLVGTTSRPDPDKSVTLRDIPRGSRTEGKDGTLCLIMGLGRKGLPASLLKDVPYHLELTGRNIPLETCTVMGILAERLRNI